MNKEEVSNRVVELTQVVGRIEQQLSRMMGRSTGEWVSAYYDAVAKMPDCFTAKEWEETEKVIYASMVEEIQGDFTYRGILESGVATKTLELFKRERRKLVEAIKARGRKG